MNEAEDIERVHKILGAILAYQHSHSGSAVPLDDLVSAGVLSPEDQAFLESHAIEYKPHPLNAYHAGDMFHLPTEDGCMFIGPAGPPLPKHRAPLPELSGIIERILQLPGPADELMLHIELSPEDGVGVAPGLLTFILHRQQWRSCAPSLKSVAAEHGLSPFQDSPEIQGNYLLSFTPTAGPRELAAMTLDLLRRGLGLADTEQMTYACGAIEAT